MHFFLIIFLNSLCEPTKTTYIYGGSLSQCLVGGEGPNGCGMELRNPGRNAFIFQWNCPWVGT